MTLAGLEPAIFGSEDQRLIHQATGPPDKNFGCLLYLFMPVVRSSLRVKRSQDQFPEQPTELRFKVGWSKRPAETSSGQIMPGEMEKRLCSKKRKSRSTKTQFFASLFFASLFFAFLIFKTENISFFLKAEWRSGQRVGLITQRSMDRDHAPLCVLRLDSEI